MTSQVLPLIFNRMQGCVCKSTARIVVGSVQFNLSNPSPKKGLAFLVQYREMKSRSGTHDHEDGNRTITIRPKKVIAHQKSKRNRYYKDSKNRSIMNNSLGLDIDYYDDVEAAQDDFEDLADAISTYGNKFTGLEANDKFWRDTTAFQRFIRAKTLENKYFKPPKKMSLLTWAAKEQIRGLHKSDPEEWTVDVLAKTFPVGKDSIQKIIKSRLKLRRPQDIMKSDLKVKNNWEVILSHLKMNQSNSDTVKDCLENVHSVDILQNVLPSKDLPHESGERISKKETAGIFSVIVKDELEKQREETEMIIGKQKQLHGQILDVVLEIRDFLSKEAGQASMKSGSRLPQASPENSKTHVKRRFQNANDDGITQHDSMDDESHTQQKEAPQRISFEKPKSQHEMFSYRVDDCVYDENGEFLYRIP